MAISPAALLWMKSFTSPSRFRAAQIGLLRPIRINLPLLVLTPRAVASPHPTRQPTIASCRPGARERIPPSARPTPSAVGRPRHPVRVALGTKRVDCSRVRRGWRRRQVRPAVASLSALVWERLVLLGTYGPTSSARCRRKGLPGRADAPSQGSCGLPRG